MLYHIKRDDIVSSPRVKAMLANEFTPNVMEKEIEILIREIINSGEIIADDELMIIGQERKYQEEADLFALDRNGVLYIFELKRWQSDTENLLQVFRYGQIFGQYDYERLDNLAKRHGKIDSDADLSEFHKEYFGLNKSLEKSVFNSEQVFVLVANGLDFSTINSVNYWMRKGIKIRCISYRLYNINGEMYFDISGYSPENTLLSETTTGYYIVNTNETYMPGIWKSMLSENKAAAYYSRKFSVMRITERSVVYLYHTGVGFIAKGIAQGGFIKTSFGNEPDMEYYIPLKFDWKIDDQSQWNAKVPTATEVNQRMGTGNRYRQTVMAINRDVSGIIDTIKKEKEIGCM